MKVTAKKTPHLFLMESVHLLPTVQTLVALTTLPSNLHTPICPLRLSFWIIEHRNSYLRCLHFYNMRCRSTLTQLAAEPDWMCINELPFYCNLFIAWTRRSSKMSFVPPPNSLHVDGSQPCQHSSTLHLFITRLTQKKLGPKVSTCIQPDLLMLTWIT